MFSMKPFHALGLVVVLSSAISGCATIGACSSKNCSDDAQISTDVQTLIDNHPDLGPPNSIRAESVNHVVYLTGQASTDLEKFIAQSVASHAPRVVSVVNTIDVSR